MARFMLRRWLSRLFPSSPLARDPFRPRLESLEDRLTPSVTFAPQATFAVNGEPSSVAVADFNGDGKPDVVAVSLYSYNLSVLLNTTPAGATAPSFAAPVTFATGVQPTSVAVGDFNGDGKLDLAVANSGPGDNTISVLLNTTAAGVTVPSFATAVTFAVGNQPDSLAVGDFNGDNRMDLVVANRSNAGTVSVLLNQTAAGATTPTFAAPTTFAVGSNPTSVAVGDFNGDNKPDVVVANDGSSGTASVLLDATATGATVASFSPQQTFAVGNSPFSVTTADFNGDGRPDLAVVNDDGTASVLVDATAAGATTASFLPQQTFNTGNGSYSLAAADFNGDGRPDLVTVNGTATVSVLLDATPAGATSLSFAARNTFTVGGASDNSSALAAGDFNGDGRIDVVTATGNGGGTASVLTNETPVVVAQFGSQGVWEYNDAQNAWVQLTPANASLLADDALGDVVGEFPGYGLWEYRPAAGAWSLVNGTDVSALAMDTLGDFAVTFPHYGVYEYSRAGGAPAQLNPSDAYALAADSVGDVFADFRGYGLYQLRVGASPVLLNGTDVSLMAVNAASELAVDFPGYGVATYSQAAGWQTLTSHQAQALAVDVYGDVAGSFQGSGGGSPASNAFPGVGTGFRRPGTAWSSLTPAVAAQMGVGADGDLFAEFTGYGVWQYDPLKGWVQLPLPGAADATLLVVA